MIFNAEMIVAALLLGLSGCVSVGYHKRALREARAENMDSVERWAKDVRDGNMNIYEMIRRIKDRRFTKKL